MSILDYQCNKCRPIRQEIAELFTNVCGLLGNNGLNISKNLSTDIKPIEIDKDKHRYNKKLNFFFDIKTHSLFNLRARRQILTGFGVFRRLFAPFRDVLVRLPVNQRYIRYDCVSENMLGLQPNLVWLQPLFNLGGSQVKIVREHEVYGILSAPSKQWLIDNEVYALTHYQDIDCVPRLKGMLCPHVYIREFVSGRTMSIRKKNWTNAVEYTLRELCNIYQISGIKKIDLNTYVEEIKCHLYKTAAGNSKVTNIIVALEGKLRDEMPQELYTARVHGDFALKNIVQQCKGGFALIDWERHTNRSVMYDICNLLFKLDHKSYLTLPDFLRNKWWYNLKEWINIVDSYLKLGGVSYQNFIGYYALFLLERLDIEFRIHETITNQRSKVILDFWLPHSRKFLCII